MRFRGSFASQVGQNHQPSESDKPSGQNHATEQSGQVRTNGAQHGNQGKGANSRRLRFCPLPLQTDQQSQSQGDAELLPDHKIHTRPSQCSVCLWKQTLLFTTILPANDGFRTTMTGKGKAPVLALQISAGFVQ
jgi:hypothetical protein